jgi:quercetin dioxygenase-like cupin family protein
MTLKELAQASSVSTSFLSQAERGLCSISIPTLGRISTALGVAMVELFAQPGTQKEERGVAPTVLRAEEQHAVNLSDAAIKYRFLSRDVPGRLFEVVVGEIPTGYVYPRASHDGEEFGYLLEGELRLFLQDEEYVLRPGDSYHLGPYEPHGYETLGEEPVRLLWVQTVKDLKIRSGTPKAPAGG